MSRSTIRRGIAVSLAAAIAAAGFAACKRNQLALLELPKVTAENEHEVIGLPPATLGGPEGGAVITTLKPRLTPTLKKPITAMTDAELVGYLNDLEYDLDPANSEIDSTTCLYGPTGPACNPGDAARVFIEPEVGMHLWKHTDIPKYGLVVARVINYSANKYEANFKFPPSRKIWWVVDSDGTGGLRSRYFVRNYQAAAPAVDPVGVALPFKLCPHAHYTPHTEAKAKFLSCAQSDTVAGYQRSRAERASASAPDPSIFRPVRFRSTVPLPMYPFIKALDAAWVTCDAGCCATS